MTEKELKRLSRSELLEMLIAQMEENEKLKTDLEKANRRQIAIDQADVDDCPKQAMKG